jgi:hypothetical protein
LGSVTGDDGKVLEGAEDWSLHSEFGISYGALGKSPRDHDVYLRIGLGAPIGALGCTHK